MGKEIDLLAKYPRTTRDIETRGATKTLEDIAIARKFGVDFFDGDRRYGYGGYSPDADRWRGVVDDIILEYGEINSFLDIGCGKGGLVRAVKDRLPRCLAHGVDISNYAITAGKEAHKGVIHRQDLRTLDVRDLAGEPYTYQRYDLVVSINTIHNLPRFGCLRALDNIQAIGKRAFVMVDAYKTVEEEQRLRDWNLTALTLLHVDDWLKLFSEAGYAGDYGWWLP